MEKANKYKKIIPIRFRESEYEFLKKQSMQPDISGKRYKNFSEFVRETLLSRNHYDDVIIKRQLADLRYEVHKIGVNINQIAKRTNAGYGKEKDLEEVKACLQKVEKSFMEYEKKVNSIWQSQN